MTIYARDIAIMLVVIGLVLAINFIAGDLP